MLAVVHLAVKTVLPAAVAIAMLAGCAGPAPVDDGAIGRWQARQDAATKDDDDLLGVLSGLVGATRSGDTEVADGGVAMTFAEPADVRGMTFSCFGHGRVRGYLVIDAGPTSRSEGVDAQCDAGPRAVEFPRTWRPGVNGVSFHTVEASDQSAWQLVIR